MGIYQSKSGIKTFYLTQKFYQLDDYLQKGFNSDSLQMPEFIDKFWNSKCAEYLDKTNLNENKPISESEKDKHFLKEEFLFHEIPLDKSVLKNTFDALKLSQYKKVFTPEATSTFSNNQLKKMNIILIAYIKKILTTCNENNTIECINKFFKSEIKKKDEFDTLGMKLFLKLLTELSSNDQKIREQNLNFLFENSKYIRPLSFYGEEKDNFAMDKAIDNVIDYLKTIVKDEPNEENKEKSIKILFNLALGKGSLNNLLDVIEYIDYIPNKIDFDYEINLFKNEFIKLSLSYPEETNLNIKSHIWNYSVQNKKPNYSSEIPQPNQRMGSGMGDAFSSNLADTQALSRKTKVHFSSTCDGTYIYLFNSCDLLKIGTGYNNTMLGKVYKIKEKYRVGERGTIAVVDNILYYRSNLTDPNPLICISTETLEEIEFPYEIDYKEINHIWAEGKREVFEFPHNSYQDMSEIIEKKMILGGEEKSNLRLPIDSPMTTDGRYIYIISKWLDDIENINERGDEEEENSKEKETGDKKEKNSIYGVDMYDPLNNMCHVKSIQLSGDMSKIDESGEKKEEDKDINENNSRIWFRGNYQNNNAYQYKENYNLQKNIGEQSKYLPSNFLSNENNYYTNGSILIINGMKFSLVTGELIEKYEYEKHISNKCYCYDFENNVIWRISEDYSRNSSMLVVSFFNKSAKPIAEYPKNHSKFSPCSIEKIIEHCEKNIVLPKMQKEVSKKVYEDQLTLDLLNLKDEETENFYSASLACEGSKGTKEEIEKYKLNLQCLILNTIAKLSNFYGQLPDLRIANNDIERGRIFSQIMRRPFCVKLEPKTFEKLINFLNKYSTNFINGKINDIEAYCFVAVIKILRTNLKCVSLSNLDTSMFIKKNAKVNPFLQVKNFIFKVFEMFHQMKDSDPETKRELLKVLYDECSIILKVSVNVLYSNYSEIIATLETHIQEFDKSRYSQDIVKCILSWMGNEENMKSLFQKLDQESIYKIFSIFKFVVSWEIQHIDNTLKDYNKTFVWNYFTISENEKIAFQFISSLQNETLKRYTKCLINDQYDHHKERIDLEKFTNALFQSVQDLYSLVLGHLSKHLEELNKKYNKDFGTSQDEEEETIETSIKPSSDNNQKLGKEIPSLEEYKKNGIIEYYKKVSKLLSENSLVISKFLFHINTLSILSSDYILSLYLLKEFTPLLKSIIQLNSKFSEFIDQKETTIIIPNERYKEIIIESEHPFPDRVYKVHKIEIPGEEGDIYLDFDPRCKINDNNSLTSYIGIYTNEKLGTYLFPDIKQIRKDFPKERLCIKKEDVPAYLVYSSNQTNLGDVYGFRLKVHNGLDVTQKIKKEDGLFNLVRTTSWVACKCAGIAIKGNFTRNLKEDEEDEKYDSIINSILFSGGIDYEEVEKENDPMLKIIISVLDGLLNEDQQIKKDFGEIMERKNKENPTALLDDKDFTKVINAFQTKLISTNLGAKVGGEKVMKLVSSVFLCIVHHSSEMEKLKNLMKLSEAEIEKSEDFSSFYKKFQLASQMRNWIIEKKKNIDEAIEKLKPKQEEEKEKESETFITKTISQAIFKAKFMMKIAPNTSSSEEQISSSILTLMKENISTKKILKRIRISVLRAIGRILGIREMTKLFNVIQNGDMLEDLISWFCSSLRNNENTFSHYLDNIPGCGLAFENMVKKSFQSFIETLINRYIKASNENDLKCFLDCLLWRYGSDDHEFLFNKGIFDIVWGTQNEKIQSFWGRRIKPLKGKIHEEYEKSKCSLSNDILDLFELLSSVCLAKIVNVSQENSNNPKNKKGNLLLEKKKSLIVEKDAYPLIQNILNVIFGEMDKASKNYYNFRGVSYYLWRQYEKSEKKNKNINKNHKIPQRDPLMNDSYNSDNSYIEFYDDDSIIDDNGSYFEDCLIPGNEYDDTHIEGEPTKAKDLKKEEKEESQEDVFYLRQMDLMNKYDDYITDKVKFFHNKKMQVSQKVFLGKIYYELCSIYSADFLNRLLQILYKISIQKSTKLILMIAKPDYFYSVIRLLKFSSTNNKLLLAKVLTNMNDEAEEETLNEVVEIYNSCLEEHGGKKCKNYIELLINIAVSIRSMSWTANKSESSSCLVISNILIETIRKVLNSGKFKDLFSKLVTEIFNADNNDYILKEIVLSVLGGDYYGMSAGGKIQIARNYSSNKFTFDFIKDDYSKEVKYGTILSFSNSMNDYFGVPKKIIPSYRGFGFGVQRRRTQEKPEEKPKSFEPLTLDPSNSIESQAAILLDNELIKAEENFSLNIINPKVYSQHQIMSVQKEVDYSNIIITSEQIKKMLPILDKKVNDPQIINLQTNICRCLSTYLMTEKGLEEFLKLENVGKIINTFAQRGLKCNSYNYTYMNLELNEEKRYRLVSYCNQEDDSLNKISQVSINIQSPSLFVFRVYDIDGKVISLCFNIMDSINNKKIKYNIYYEFAFNAEDKNIIFTENPDQYKSNENKIIFTYADLIKSKEVNSTMIKISRKTYEEIFTISKEIKEKGKYAFPIEDYKDLVEELVTNFGFSKTAVESEISKMNGKKDIYQIISNLLDLNEKSRVTQENPTVIWRDDKGKFDDDYFESEGKNNYFVFQDEDTNSFVPEYYSNLFISKEDGPSLIFKDHESLNKKIAVLYYRRMILTLFESALKLDKISLDDLIKEVDVPMLIRILKLLTHEGLFVDASGFISEILTRVKELVTLLTQKDSETSKKVLQEIYTCLITEISQVIKEPPSTSSFVTQNEEDFIDRPYLFFNIWFIMLMNENFKPLEDPTMIFNLFSGLIPKIIENKELRWLILEALIQYASNILTSLNDKEYFEKLKKAKIQFKLIPNIQKLSNLLSKSIVKEGIKDLSKRTQMITELLIFIYEIDKKLFLLSEPVTPDHYDYLFGNNEIENDNKIYDLVTTNEIMKNFFDMNFLKYLAWIEINPEILSSLSSTFESSHLYSKSPVTYLLNYPNTIGLEVTVQDDTYFDQGEALTFSSDKNCLYPTHCVSNKSKKKFMLNSSHTFVNFPSNYLTELYAFGLNQYSRFSIKASQEIFLPKLIEELTDINVKNFYIGNTFTVALTSNNEVLSCGNGIGGGLKNTSTSYTDDNIISKNEKIEESQIKRFYSRNSSTFVELKNNQTLAIGENDNANLGVGIASNMVNELKEISLTNQLKEISMGYTHNMFLTEKNEVFHSGDNYYSQSGESGLKNQIPKMIFFPPEIEIEKIACGYQFSLFLGRNKQTNKINLYSAGNCKNGRTGRGLGKENGSHPFTIVECKSLNNVELKHITCGKNSAAAISNDGKLFTWGENIKGQLGLGHYNDVFEPTYVTALKDYNVLDVKMDTEHTLILAQEKSTSSNVVFGCGDGSSGKLGISFNGIKTEKKDTTSLPIVIPFFLNKNPIKIFVGPKGNVVQCKPKEFHILRDNHNVNCTKCKNNIIGELLYDYSDNCVYCRLCADFKKNYLLFKAPLKDYIILPKLISKFKAIEYEDFADGTKPKCCQCDLEIQENSNVPYMTFVQNEKSRKFICDKCLQRYPSSITNSKVFYYSYDYTKTISMSTISILNETNYYDTSIGYGYKFKVSPIYNDIGCETVIKKFEKSFKAFSNEINQYNKPEVYEQFVNLLNDMSEKKGKPLLNFTSKDLAFKKKNMSARSALEECSNEILKKMFCLLKVFNLKVQMILPYIDFTKPLNNKHRLSVMFRKISPLVFWEIKNSIIKSNLEKTFSDVGLLSIKINRLKVRKFIDKGLTDHLGEHTIFGQIFQNFRNIPFTIFRKKDTIRSNKLFDVQFIGEASIDAGGPYREALTQAASELQSSALPLFIPSPNQKNDSGVFREKFIVNPESTSFVHLEMYKFLGGLMGYAMRTGEFLNMDLPSIFWKNLLEIPPERKDLEYIDKYVIQYLDNIMHCNTDTFTAYSEQRFTTLLSNGEEVELCPGGKDITLTLENRAKYCELVEKVRFNESKIQIDAIRKGLEEVIPNGLLYLISWFEFEMLVCGNPILDIEFLKENTQYRGCSELDPVVQNLWLCLEQFNAEERSMYLRFVWGRSRLPLTTKDFTMKHKIEIIQRTDPDLALPLSHTCFFLLEIPRYSTYEILKEKLKYAITHCQAIDTDGRPQEIWDEED